MSLKQKGINAERELIHKFWALGWACIRSAGSGSMRHPSPDILVGNVLRKLAIEAKVCGSNQKYFDHEEVEQLKQFATIFGAEPWIAIKFLEKKDWLFLMLEDLQPTEKHYVASLELAERRGLLLEEVVERPQSMSSPNQ